MIDQARLSQRYNEIKGSHRFREVGFCDQQYSNYPLGSSEYRNCNGVVLIGVCGELDEDSFRFPCAIPRNGAVLTHYGNTGHQPPLTKDQIIIYLRMALARVQIAGVEEVIAGIVGGDEKHFNTIVDFLDREHVDIRGRYLDGASDDPNEPSSRPNKDLVVSPGTEEAILLVENRNFYPLL